MPMTTDQSEADTCPSKILSYVHISLYQTAYQFFGLIKCAFPKGIAQPMPHMPTLYNFDSTSEH